MRLSTVFLGTPCARALRWDSGVMNTSTFLSSDQSSERGAATAEYAIATVAAAGFAGLLAVVLKSNPVQSLLTNLISGALSIIS